MTYTEKTDLFEQNMNIVYYCFNKLNKNEFVVRSQEDLIQEGLMALWNSVLTYDSSKAEKFSTYAFPCVKNSMLKWIKNNSVFNCSSLEEPLNTVEGEDVYLKDVIPVECDFESIENLKHMLIKQYEKWLHTKHKSEKTILLRIARASAILEELVDNSKITLTEIEKKYKLKRTIISNILGEIRYMLKNEYPTFYLKTKRNNAS